MARRCVHCDYCKSTTPKRINRTSILRRKYYCVHPSLKYLPVAVFCHRESGLIGIGDTGSDSRLKIKTHPRWCPMELFKE